LDTFLQDVLKTRNKRFSDEIESAIEREVKRKELDNSNEYTLTRTIIDNAKKANDEEVVFWISDNQKRRKMESLITSHKPILM